MTQAAAIPLQPIIDLYKTDPTMTPQKWVQWACDCAERVLHRYVARHPGDDRPARAIAAARRWVANPTKENADAAAYAADAAPTKENADAAAYAADAAAYAADAAACAAYAADAADAAACAAAYAAYAAYAACAACAADAAVYAAAEEQWQAIHLMEIYHDC